MKRIKSRVWIDSQRQTANLQHWGCQCARAMFAQAFGVPDDIAPIGTVQRHLNKALKASFINSCAVFHMANG